VLSPSKAFSLPAWWLPCSLQALSMMLCSETMLFSDRWVLPSCFWRKEIVVSCANRLWRAGLVPQGTLAQHQAVAASFWGPTGAELGQFWAGKIVSVWGDAHGTGCSCGCKKVWLAASVVMCLQPAKIPI